MLEVLKRWYQTRFSNPDAVTLFLLLVFCFTIIWLFGNLLAPLLVALVMAYLLEWPVAQAAKSGAVAHPGHQRHSDPLYCSGGGLLAGSYPDAGESGDQSGQEAPAMLTHAQDYVRTLPDKYPS